LQRAWAAGFLDGEGCFGLARAGRRKRGPDWYRVRASASQHGEIGVAADVLVKVQRIIGLGRIELHGAPDDYKWVVEGADRIEQVLAVVGPWLGPIKVAQAREALARFRSQRRLKGDADRCVRGHTYSGLALRGGRLRHICAQCARLRDRAERAAMGTPPRPFKNVARRYTE